MITIETDRLILRNFGADDWQDLQEMIIKYQESEYAQYDHKWPTAAKEIKGIVQWFAGGDSYLAVCLKTMNKLIGLIAIDRREEQEMRVNNLGYIFHPDYHGRGYALEGCRKTMEYVFDKLAAERILSGTYPTNQPSVRLLKNLGLKETAPGEFVISREEWLVQSQASKG